MACLICGDGLGDGEFLALYTYQIIIMNDTDEPLRRPIPTGDGFHLQCFKAVLTGVPKHADEEEEPPLMAFPEAGYCGYPGCINKAYSTPEGAKCAAGHIMDPLNKPYREGDQD